MPSVVPCDIKLMMSAMEKIMSLVLLSCITFPLRIDRIFRFCGSFCVCVCVGVGVCVGVCVKREKKKGRERGRGGECVTMPLAGVTMTGPSGQNVSKLFAKHHCDPPFLLPCHCTHTHAHTCVCPIDNNPDAEKNTCLARRDIVRHRIPQHVAQRICPACEWAVTTSRLQRENSIHTRMPSFRTFLHAEPIITASSTS